MTTEYGTVTVWLEHLTAGDLGALQPIWER
jgi:hypothetical protein